MPHRPAGRQLLRRRGTCVPSRSLYTSRALRADFTHVVIGAGVVGLAVARTLASRAGTSTLLVERHARAGTETSSRNSEVVHAGLYYGTGSLKARLCVRGAALLRALCSREPAIALRTTGKWVVAQDDEQLQELRRLHAHAGALGVPTRLLTPAQAAAAQPAVRARAGVLDSPSTAIVDSHALMAWLEGAFQAAGGTLAFRTAVTALEHDPTRREFRVHTADTGSAPITARTLVNSAGLAAIPVSNMLLPPPRRLQPYYARGTYYSYAPAAGAPPLPTTLVYPAPRPGAGRAGLGTHLTLDLACPPRARFGPDVEWVRDPADYTPGSDGGGGGGEAALQARLTAALDAVAEYLPGLQRERVAVDYCGIRPKLGGPDVGPCDFVVRREEGFGDGGGRGAFVNLLGIESPGLTSCLAIAEEVEGLVYG